MQSEGVCGTTAVRPDLMIDKRTDPVNPLGTVLSKRRGATYVLRVATELCAMKRPVSILLEGLLALGAACSASMGGSTSAAATR